MMELEEAVDPVECVMIIPTWDLGHAEVRWKSGDPKDVQAAREAFAEYKSKGYAAYRVDPKTGDKGEILKEFDPKAEKIIVIAPMAGG